MFEKKGWNGRECEVFKKEWAQEFRQNFETNQITDHAIEEEIQEKHHLIKAKHWALEIAVRALEDRKGEISPQH